MIKLYGYLKATCTMRVLILLEELKLPYQLHKIDLLQREQKDPEYIKIQPFGKVPALDDNGFIIFESRCIIKYLSKKYDKNSIMNGTNFEEETLIDNWLEVEGQNFNPPIASIVFEKVFKKMLGFDTDSYAVVRGLQQLHQVLDVYEKILSQREYIAGENFTLADISHMPYSYFLYEVADLKEPFEIHPNVFKWYKKIIGRDSWNKILKMD